MCILYDQLLPHLCCSKAHPLHASKISPSQLMQEQLLKLLSDISSASLCLSKLSDSTHTPVAGVQILPGMASSPFNGLASNSSSHWETAGP